MKISIQLTSQQVSSLNVYLADDRFKDIESAVDTVVPLEAHQCLNPNQKSSITEFGLFTYEGARHPFVQDKHLESLVCAVMGEAFLPYKWDADNDYRNGRQLQKEIACVLLEQQVMQYTTSQMGWKFWETLDDQLAKCDTDSLEGLIEWYELVLNSPDPQSKFGYYTNSQNGLDKFLIRTKPLLMSGHKLMTVYTPSECLVVTRMKRALCKGFETNYFEKEDQEQTIEAWIKCFIDNSIIK